jgi:hypothetical protein
MAAVAATMMSTVAQAQIVFTTTGAFTGCGTVNTSGPTATCGYASGSTLTYQTQGEQSVIGFGFVDFGTFTTSGAASQNYAGATFELRIAQTSPTAGNQNVMGTITGTIQAQQGGLVWVPSMTTFAIGGVNYQIFVDAQTGGVAISAPAAGGAAGQMQTIRGQVSVVPEPSTYMLMAAGLAGVGFVARRRRSA